MVLWLSDLQQQGRRGSISGETDVSMYEDEQDSEGNLIVNHLVRQKARAISCAVTTDNRSVARQFEPSQSMTYGLGSHNRQLLYYNEELEINQLISCFMAGANAREEHVADHTLVVQIASRKCTCTSGCFPGCPQFSWGMYFGPGSRHNTSKAIDDVYQQTDMQALLDCLQETIRLVGFIAKDIGTINVVRIQTDDEDLVDILAWGGRACDHWDDHESAEIYQSNFDDASREWFEQERRREMQIQLWLVREPEVGEAARLADQAILARQGR